MSQPGLPPKEIVPQLSTGADDASALTAPTGAAAASTTPSVFDLWLKANEESLKWFKLTKCKGNISSPIWQFFHVVVGLKDDIGASDVPVSKWLEDSVFACCNSCGTLLKAASKDKSGKAVNWSNGSMNNHLVGKHSTNIEQLLKETNPDSKKRKLDQQLLGQFLKPSSSPPLKLQKPHKQVLITRFVIDNMLPLSIVESQSFRDMIGAHDKHSKPMSNKKVKNIAIKLEAAMRDAAMDKMEGQCVCFTLDHWTSKANQNFTGFTAHFISEDFKMNSLNLGMMLHSGGTRTEDLVVSFLDLYFNKLKTKVAKIFAGTTDTTASMNKFGMMLEAMGITHVYCTDHNLQLTCKLCYEGSMDDTFGAAFVDSVKKARKLVGFFNHSTQALEKLHQKQAVLDSCPGQPKGVLTGVVTCWWATFLMFEHLLEIKPAIGSMAIDNQLGDCDPLEVQDWENLKVIKDVLEPFRDSQKLLEGDKYVTASWVPQAVNHIRKKLTAFSEAEEESASKTLATSLLKDLDDRWFSNLELFSGTVQHGRANRQFGIHPALMIASFLDPRFKSLPSTPDATREAIHARVLEIMKQLETEHRDSAGTANNPMDVEEDGKESENEDDGLFADLQNEVVAAEAGDQEAGLESVDSVCADEMKHYLAEKSLKISFKDSQGKRIFSDPLKWWKEHQSLYPIMASLARIYLAVQGTSAPSERIFSMASRVISDKRARLNPELAGKLLFVSENWEWWKNELNYAELALETEE